MWDPVPSTRPAYPLLALAHRSMSLYLLCRSQSSQKNLKPSNPFSQFLSESALFPRSPLHRQQISTVAALQAHMDGKPMKKSWSSADN
ncbi:hypothetical protein ACFX13_013351 [Malus domestica]